MGLDAAQLLEGAAEATMSGGALNDPLLPATPPGSLEWFPGEVTQTPLPSRSAIWEADMFPRHSSLAGYEMLTPGIRTAP